MSKQQPSQAKIVRMVAPFKAAPGGSAGAAAKQKSEEDALRAQLHEEIEERSRLCSYRRHACHLPRLAGHAYCAEHILCDPAAPYRRCRHVAGGRRCHAPAPITNYRRDLGLCFEHARAALAVRARHLARAAPKPSTEEMLLSLTHYVNPERPRTESCASQVSVVSEASDRPDSPLHTDPFKHVDATEVNSWIGPRVLECRSSSSESELPRAGGADEDSSGAEDTQLDAAPLRYAGIYTCEEVVSETGANLRRLQALYLEQLRGLATRLREARRSYLAGLKQEKESHCSIAAQGAQTAEERKELAVLKAATAYRRKHGTDAVLHRKLCEKRAKITEGSVRSGAPPSGRCLFTEGGVKCARAALPSARHCAKHILGDRHQVLFRACGARRAGLQCGEPIPALHPADTCTLHQELLPYQTFSLKKYESDSEDTAVDAPSRDASLAATPGAPA